MWSCLKYFCLLFCEVVLTGSASVRPVWCSFGSFSGSSHCSDGLACFQHELGLGESVPFAVMSWTTFHWHWGVRRNSWTWWESYLVFWDDLAVGRDKKRKCKYIVTCVAVSSFVKFRDQHRSSQKKMRKRKQCSGFKLQYWSWTWEKLLLKEFWDYLPYNTEIIYFYFFNFFEFLNFI